MFDFRTELVSLAEKCVYNFTKIRLASTQMANSWKNGLPEYVKKQYPVRPANYEFLHDYFSKNDPATLELEMLDITALMPLLLFYEPFEVLHNIYPNSRNNTTKSRLYDIEDLRNTLTHYPKVIVAKHKSRFLQDQVDACSILVRFCLNAEKHLPNGEVWKVIINDALYYQDLLRKEKWFVLQEQIDSDSFVDVSDLETAADKGNLDAQVIVAKLYYEGKRVKPDKGKAFMWFYKAALKGNPEAEYYLGRCYSDVFCTDPNFQMANKWMLKAAQHGFAAAQYEMGVKNFAVSDAQPDSLQEMVHWLQLSADQDYPPAIWVLSLCYEMGRGINKDIKIAESLKVKAATLGNGMACVALAKEAIAINDLTAAQSWYKIGAENGNEEAQGALTRFEQRGRF